MRSPSNPHRELLEEMRGIVCNAVEIARAECGHTGRAVEVAAERLGIIPRRVEAYWWNEAKKVDGVELETLRRAAVRIHAEEAEKHRQRHEDSLRAKRDARERLRPALQLRAPEGPRKQERLAL